MSDPIETAVRTLIRAGSTYDLPALAQCYDPALEIVMVGPDGSVMLFDHAANMVFSKAAATPGRRRWTRPRGSCTPATLKPRAARSSNAAWP